MRLFTAGYRAEPAAMNEAADGAAAMIINKKAEKENRT